MKVLGVCGARPNFMKIDPVFRALEARPDRFETHLVHTGQHYDDRMSRIFFDELQIRRPDTNLSIGSGTHAEQTAAVMVGIERLIQAESIDLVLVVGDVNSTMAATLAAAKLGIPVAHVEAGLRSFDRTMPEEINRIVTDSIADLLLTPSRDGDENLRNEGIPDHRIHFVGNVMIDTLQRCRDRADQSDVLARLGITKNGYALLTLHRPANVDDPLILEGLFRAIAHVQQQIPVVFPLHPRTRGRIEQHGLGSLLDSLNGLILAEPQGYLDFLALQANARMALSDSGGVQEETTVLGVPCLTLRENTERPVTVSEGTNRLVGHDPVAIMTAADEILLGQSQDGRVPELWDGQASERIADVLESFMRQDSVCTDPGTGFRTSNQCLAKVES